MTPTVEEAEVLHAKAHKFLMWRMVLQQRVTYSDNTFAYVPEMATWLFNTFLVLEFLFLGVNLWTEAPFVFERCMPYHLAFSALCLGWWASVYVGLDLARYPGYLSRQRTAFGFFLLFAATLSLIMADTGAVEYHSPWKSYYSLLCLYLAMQLFDVRMLSLFLIPSWLYRWKTLQAGVTGAALVVGLWKGKHMEKNAGVYLHRAMVDMTPGGSKTVGSLG